MNKQQVLDIVMDGDFDIDMSEISYSDSFVLSNNIKSNSNSTSESTGGRNSDQVMMMMVKMVFIFQAFHSSLAIDKFAKKEETTYGRLLTSNHLYLCWNAKVHSQSCRK